MNYYRCIGGNGGGGGTSTPLWAPADLITGQYVNNNNGSFVNDGSAARSPLVEVTQSQITVFTASDWNNIYNAWYDANGDFISSFSLTRGNTIMGALDIVSKPAGAKYVCISNGANSMQNVRAWDGNIK